MCSNDNSRWQGANTNKQTHTTASQQEAAGLETHPVSGHTYLIMVEGDHSITVGCLGFGGHCKEGEARVPCSVADNLSANVGRKLDLVVKED